MLARAGGAPPSFAPPGTLPPVPSSPDIHLLSCRGQPPHRQIAMVWRRSSAMGNFLQQLAAEFRKLPEQLLRPPSAVAEATHPVSA